MHNFTNNTLFSEKKKEMLEVMLLQFDAFTKWPKKNEDKFRLIEKLEGSAGVYGVGDKLEFIREREELKESYFTSDDDLIKEDKKEE